jgi:hypothetical protein
MGQYNVKDCPILDTFVPSNRLASSLGGSVEGGKDAQIDVGFGASWRRNSGDIRTGGQPVQRPTEGPTGLLEWRLLWPALPGTCVAAA